MGQDFTKGETHTLQQLIAKYQKLDSIHESAQLFDIGMSDQGFPIHVFLISNQTFNNIQDLNQSDQVKILINNGIHPGEACGVEASLNLANKILNENLLHQKNVIVAIIPAYNIGGMLNRGSYSRANQNGPKEYGFRGNAKNLDLNRDFIKMDSKNAFAFVQLFHSYDPDIFIDTHTTNGSDHQYTLTLISSQKDKMNPRLSEFNETTFLPSLYKSMEQKGHGMIPYVYSLKKVPKDGIHAFLETPRYSSGYTNLFNCLSYITEAHVFKPFKERVIQTRSFLESIITLSDQHSKEIKQIKQASYLLDRERTFFPIKWELDTSTYTPLMFKGYESKVVESKVTDLNILNYDKSDPYQSKIKYFNTYQTSDSVAVPKYYVIPQAYADILQRLKANEIEMTTLTKDTSLELEYYRILSFETVKSPYEGHYMHFDVKTEKEQLYKTLYKGDVLVPTQQKKVRFLIETLEPRAHDSYFVWNFFDNILQQKEWFSDYAFEPKADSILKENSILKANFEAKKKADKDFAGSNFQQLYYIYKQSKYYEQSVNLYPIYRIN